MLKQNGLLKIFSVTIDIYEQYVTNSYSDYLFIDYSRYKYVKILCRQSYLHLLVLSAKDRQFIIKSFTDNYSGLIALDQNAWRGKFRKMAQTPFAFYRGSAALFYSDVSHDKDPFLNEKTSRVWIQGDLHAENFEHMNGRYIDFDVAPILTESYVAPFNWDVKRFCASLALIGYQKALSDVEIREIIAHGARSYARQVARFAAGEDKNFALTLDNTKGALLQVLYKARTLTRVGLLDAETDIIEGDRNFKNNKSISPVDDTTRKKVEAALEEYYNTIPNRKRRSKITYQIKDIALRRGLGIGSAGLKIYSILLEGETQALENDIIISMKVAQPSASEKYVKDKEAKAYSTHKLTNYGSSSFFTKQFSQTTLRRNRY